LNQNDADITNDETTRPGRKSMERADLLESTTSANSRLDDFDSSVSYEHSNKEMEFVSDFYDLPNKFQLLVASLCPSIYGHEIIKASLLLGLVGGCQRCVDDPSEVPIRGDIHVLIVGDPGLGKSQMLQAVSQAKHNLCLCLW
jgi:DNA helicase MCM8